MLLEQTYDLDNDYCVPEGVAEVIDDVSVGTATNKRSSISLVYPAYNEETNIRRAVELGLEVFSRYFEQVEVVVVNDGSADETGSIIDQLAEEHSGVVALHHDGNKGYGAAVTNGLYASKSELVFFTDSDMQFDLNEITRLLEHIDDYDIVSGYRENRADPAHRRLNAWCWNRLIRTLLGVKVRDLDCAFKLFKRSVFETINVSSEGAMVNAEILSRANKHNFTFKEVPVSHYERRSGTQTGANPRVILNAFGELFKLYGHLKNA